MLPHPCCCHMQSITRPHCDGEATGSWTMTTSARQNPEVSECGKLLPSHPGLPQLLMSSPAWTACLQALPWLDDAWASAPPRFPTCASRPQCGAHPVSLTRTGTGPQTHRNMIPAASPSAYFRISTFNTLFSIPCKIKPLDPIQCCSAHSPCHNFPRVPSAVRRLRSLPIPAPGFPGSLGYTCTGAFLSSYKAVE